MNGTKFLILDFLQLKNSLIEKFLRDFYYSTLDISAVYKQVLCKVISYKKECRYL